MKRVLSGIGVVLVVGSLWVWYEVTTFHCPGGPDGPFETYYDNGQVFEKGTVKDGCWDGPFESYHDNGQLESKGIYKDGEKCGEWLEEGETVPYDLPC